MKFVFLAVVLSALCCAGCSWLPNHHLDYQTAKPTKRMQLPSGMTMSGEQALYPLPDKGPLLSKDKYGHFSVPEPVQMKVVEQQQKVPSGPAPAVSKIKSTMSEDGDGYPMIMINTYFDWAWEYVGNALHKGGFDVTDKDRAGGIYFVKVSRSYDLKNPNVQVKLSHTANGIQVVVMNSKGDALLAKEPGHLLLARVYAEL